MAATEQVLEFAIPTAQLEETRQTLRAQFPNILIGTAPLEEGQTLLWLSLWADSPQMLEAAVEALKRDHPDFRHAPEVPASLADLVARVRQAQEGQPPR